MNISPYDASANNRRLAAVERPRRAFRWTAAGAFTAVLVIVGAVAHAIPGRSTVATTSSTSTSSASASTTGSPASTGSSVPGRAPLSPPATAPTPTRQAPAAVSGGTGW